MQYLNRQTCSLGLGHGTFNYITLVQCTLGSLVCLNTSYSCVPRAVTSWFMAGLGTKGQHISGQDKIPLHFFIFFYKAIFTLQSKVCFLSNLKKKIFL